MRATLLMCLVLAAPASLAGCGTTAPCACDGTTSLVCGDDGKTYANACFAACRGTTVARAGDCNAHASCTSCDGSLALVCGGNGLSYANRCLAECNGVGVQGEGSCPYTPHAGGKVCAVDGDCFAFSGVCGFQDCYAKADPPSSPPPCVGCPEPGCASQPSPGCFCESGSCTPPLLKEGDPCDPARDLCRRDFGEGPRCCPTPMGPRCVAVTAGAACP